MKTKKIEDLVWLYKQMGEDQIQEEIDAIFDLVFAVLEAKECDSIEVFLNPNVKLKISCDVIKDQQGNYFN